MKTTFSIRLLRALLTFSWWTWIVLSVTAVLMVGIMSFASPERLNYSFIGFASDIETDGLSAATRDGAAVSVSLAKPAKVTLSLPAEKGSPPGLFMAGCLAFILVGVGAGLLFLKQMRGIVATVEDGDPFVLENARRLRVIGALVLVIGIMRPLGELGVGVAMQHLLVTEGFQLSTRFGLDYASLLAGLAVIALSEVFRHGAMLREEQALTV